MDVKKVDGTPWGKESHCYCATVVVLFCFKSNAVRRPERPMQDKRKDQILRRWWSSWIEDVIGFASDNLVLHGTKLREGISSAGNYLVRQWLVPAADVSCSKIIGSHQPPIGVLLPGDMEQTERA
jgi:hypothetical protein